MLGQLSSQSGVIKMFSHRQAATLYESVVFGQLSSQLGVIKMKSQSQVAGL